MEFLLGIVNRQLYIYFARKEIGQRRTGVMFFPLLRLHAQTSMTILVLTLNQPEQIVNIKFAALATTFLLITGCAMNGTSTSTGSSSTGTEQASAALPTGRTRAEVHAEAVEAVKNHKPTQEEERDYFNPYAR